MSMDALHLTTNLLAQSVRAHRESRRLSLGALSQQTGIPKTSLSRIEAGQGNPSLDVLCRIANALQVLMGSLFGEDDRPQLQVTRSDQGRVMTSGSGLVVRSLLTEGRNQRTEIYEIRVPGQGVHHSLAHLAGTREFLICLEGDLTSGPKGQEVQLHAGDSVWFSADLAHSYTSVHGAKALLVMCYPPVYRECTMREKEHSPHEA